MTSIITKTARLAVLALAAPFVAHAEPATVKVSDLNMAQPAQVQEFNRRVEQAAHQVCASYAERRDLEMYAACASAVRDEATDKLAQQQAANPVNLASR